GFAPLRILQPADCGRCRRLPRGRWARTSLRGRSSQGAGRDRVAAGRRGGRRTGGGLVLLGRDGTGRDEPPCTLCANQPAGRILSGRPPSRAWFYVEESGRADSSRGPRRPAALHAEVRPQAPGNKLVKDSGRG